MRAFNPQHLLRACAFSFAALAALQMMLTPGLRSLGLAGVH
jgi:hypothetical protein